MQTIPNYKIRVITFNIRYSGGDIGKKNDWKNRKELVISLIKNYNPDIIGFQEVLMDQFDYLKSELNNYKWYGIGREDGSGSGEHCPIFYKGFEAKKSGTFWLSDTPDIPSKTWGGLHRICSWLKLENPSITVFNTHFDHLRETTRFLSAKLMVKRVKEISQGDPFIILGDLNTHRGSKTYNTLKNHFVDAYIADKNNKNDKKITYHIFSGDTTQKRFHFLKDTIDYIWIDGFSVLKAEIINYSPKSSEGIYPSDHWPIYVDLIIKNNNADS